MRRYKYVVEEPFVSIFKEEWKNYKQKLHKIECAPKFKWDMYMPSRTHGWCFSSQRLIAVNKRYLQYSNKQEYLDCFRGMIRHEFAHLNTRGHGSDFLHVLKMLGGHRYAPISFREKKKPRYDHEAVKEWEEKKLQMA